MFKSIVPVSSKLHTNVRLQERKDFNFADKLTTTSVMVPEFSKVASLYPIVFVEDKKSDKFQAVALLGLEENKNLFVKEGKWIATYIPSSIRRYPFTLATINKNEPLVICIDEECELLNEKEGHKLFDNNGNSLDYMIKVKKHLTDHHRMSLFTEEFITFLREHNMLMPLNMKVKLKEKSKNIKGVYIINEERLNSLNDFTFLELRNKQYIKAIYKHLSSLYNIEKLVRYVNENNKMDREVRDDYVI